MKIKGAFPVRWAAQDGKDGRSYERRYLSLSSSTVPSSYNPNTNISQWSSTITAIDETKRYRFVTERSSADGGSSWSQWSTPQIDAYLAENGTSFAVKGAAVGIIAYGGSLPANPEVGVYLDQRANTNDINEYNGSSWSGSNVAIGDAYILDGNLYVKSRDASTSASVLRWKDAGSIRGPQGEGGKDAIILDLDNENDSILYDGADNPISTPVESQASLYKGAGTVSSGVTYRIISVSGATMMNSGNATSGSYDREDYPSAVWISTSGKVTVNGLTSSQCEVLVGAEFNGEPYTQKLTVKKLRGVDKYELVCTPSALTYNSTTGKNPQQDVNIKVFRTGQDGVRSLVQSLSTYGLQLRYYWITNGTDAGPTSITDGTAAGYYNGGVTKTVYAKYYTAYRYELLNSGGLLLDSETVPISRVSDGIGTPGASAKSIYKNSFLKPSTPSGSSPSGWNNSPTDQTEIKLQAQGDWYLTDDGFLTAPLIGNGQTSVETLSFITTVANQPLFLRLRCNTSSNDRIYIGNVDSVSPTTNYHREMHGSNQDSLDLEITVQNPGTHFICVAYVRGSSGTSEYVKFICGNMYVWKSDALTFNTNGTVATWSTPYKISGKDAAFTTAVKTNLLLQSSFISTRMDKWDIKNGATTSGIDGRNSYHGSPYINTDYRELLAQVMHVPNGDSRLLANTWYTLSFWAKAAPYVQVNKNLTSANYGFAQQICYFEQGVQNTVWANGYCSSAARSAGKSLRIFVYKRDWSWSTSVAITSTSSTTVSMTFTVPSTGEYIIEAYVYLEPNGGNTAVSGQTATLNWYRIDRGMRMITYLYPSGISGSDTQADYTIIDVGAGRIKDGVIFGNTTPTDNNATWQLTEEWTKHTLTFKTRSYIPARAQSFLIRMAQSSNEVFVCMPKIEQGTVATDYCTNDNDIADFAADETGFPNDRNIWVDDPDEEYLWNDERRDYVTYDISGEWKRYFVKTKGMIVPNGVAPSAGGNDYWSEGSRINTLLVNTIVGANAELRFAKTNRLLVMKADGSTVAAGLGGAEDGDYDYPLWIGATYANRENAPFKVNLLGHMYATRGYIGSWVIKEQKLYSQLGTLNGSVSNDYDNDSFIPNLTLNAVSGELNAGNILKIDGAGMRMFDGNRTCLRMTSSRISSQIDTSPSKGSGTVNSSSSQSLYLPTSTPGYTSSTTWVYRFDLGQMYTNSTIRIQNARIRCSFPGSVGNSYLSYRGGYVRVYLQAGGVQKYLLASKAIAYGATSVDETLTFDSNITIDGSTYPEEHYYISYEVYVQFSSSGGSSGSSESKTIYVSNSAYNYSRAIETLLLFGTNGIFNRQSTDTYMWNTEEGFLVRKGNYALRVTNSGIQKSTNGGSTWSNL